ncbi:MAG: malate dehydrogenase, partial [SAR324 cluster bacterium]|nr:malate dehydrogenase [SAR324 cluster bacterium]
GSAIIKARGASSAASAANAALDTVTRINAPTPEGDWFSTAIPSDGSYEIPEGLIFSFPLRSKGKGDYEIVQGLKLNEFSKEKIQATSSELEMERDAVKEMLS